MAQKLEIKEHEWFNLSSRLYNFLNRYMSLQTFFVRKIIRQYQ